MFDDLLDKQVTRKEFLSEVGIGLVLLLILPSMASWLFKEEQRFKMKGNNVFYREQSIIEVTEE